jgi:hypothetical protein
VSLYLLHFEKPYGHASHYLALVVDEATIASRVETHRAGHGSPLVAAAVNAGIAVELVRIWPESDRSEERRLKSGHGSSRCCPLCNPRRKTYGVIALDAAQETEMEL